MTAPDATADEAAAATGGADPRARLAARLEARIAEVGGPAAAVTELDALTGGASRQMWRVRTDADAPWNRFVLRMDHPSDPDPEANEQEAQALIAAEAAGVPAPAVLDHASDSEVLGTPYVILAFVDGETIARKILRDDRFAAARRVLPAQLGDAIGRIHAIDASGLDLPELTDPVSRLHEDYDEAAVERPAILLGLRELTRRRPEASPRRSFVHGDFRMGNLMVDEDGLAAVLDWELPHLGDPFEDLGYVCTRAWRFGGTGRVAGVGEADEFLAAYEAVTGVRPTDDELTWWEARGTAWWGIGCLRQMQRSVPGHANELELLAIGRRTAEQEHDLLELLYPDIEPEEFDAGDGVGAGGGATASSASGAAPTLFTEPDAGTLLSALESYLDADIVRGSGEPNRFKARVAKNVVSLLGRERESGPAADRWFAGALARLGVRDEPELAERIRGLADTSAENPEVRAIVAVLKRAARLRLAVSNPKYL